ncbi:MAG: glycine cleavage system aminomethyltransferase GcvT [Solirubrobacterales bacterium]|nr:glycine cleavage system aminomethyltransferase GcvT [Solirubrobacterales bacterium]MBV9715838.1 glycine cleavage system aminomethyltransferase GcvT [Solirubrobacterales bacterium]
MSSTAETSLRRTALHERHVAAGAKLVPFAGWEMPVQYAGIRAEHVAVRRDVGVFDVSHMGQVETRGPQALAFLQRMLSGDVRRIPEGGAQYGVLCREDGGVLDDIITYRMGEFEFLTVTNAARHAKDLAWLQAHAAEFDVDVIDKSHCFAMLAVQGPRARALTRSLADGPPPIRRRCAERTLAGAAVTICGTGYTGEDGVELLVDPGDATRVWDALIAAGASPVGLGARDTLRLEACFPLYGNDLSEERNPVEAGLGACCREATGFIGAEAVAAARRDGTAERLVPFAIAGRGIARPGNPVTGGGVVTSGTYSPCLGRGIGLAYVSSELAEPGTEIEIDVRGSRRSATVERKPLYRGKGS